MENSRKKQFTSFKEHAVPSGVMKSQRCLTQNENPPHVQHLHAVNAAWVLATQLLSWWSDWLSERDHIHVTSIAVYCYNCSILLLVAAVKLLLCLVYKLNFTLGMYA